MNASNDKLVKNVIAEADKLYAEREHFETITLARTNKELYDILGHVLGLYMKADEKECMADTIKAMKPTLAERGVKVQSNTNKMTVFVRYVFNSDRKRAYAYTQTLLAALDNNIKPEELAEFIGKNDGVEEIKRTRSKTPEVVQAAAELDSTMKIVAEELAKSRPISKLEMPNDSVALSDGTSFAFVMARLKANGDLELVRAVPETTKAMEKAAIKAIAKEVLKKREADANEAATADLKAAKQVAKSTASRVPEMA